MGQCNNILLIHHVGSFYQQNEADESSSQIMYKVASVLAGVGMFT